MSLVFTGGPYSGKTSVLLALGRLGFVAVGEAAEEQLRAEVHIRDSNATVFFDRGIIDIAAYTEFCLGRSHPRLFEHAPGMRYDAVFSFDMLPWEKTDDRFEGCEADAKMIAERLIAAYELWGYSPIRVPVMPIAARCNFILRNLSAL